MLELTQDELKLISRALNALIVGSHDDDEVAASEQLVIKIYQERFAL